jgi:hypothetical protein
MFGARQNLDPLLVTFDSRLHVDYCAVYAEVVWRSLPVTQSLAEKAIISDRSQQDDEIGERHHCCDELTVEVP